LSLLLFLLHRNICRMGRGLTWVLNFPRLERCYPLLAYRLLICSVRLRLCDFFLPIAGFTSAPTTARSQLTSLGNQTNRPGSKAGQRQGSRPTSAGLATSKGCKGRAIRTKPQPKQAGKERWLVAGPRIARKMSSNLMFFRVLVI